MRKILIGAAAAAALLAPGIASADTNAVVGIQAGNTDFDGDDFDHYGLSGGFSHDMNNGWVFQMDGEHGRSDLSGTDLGSSYGAVHYGVRNDSYALAGFVGLDEFFALSGTQFGAEGQMYFGNFVVGGSAGIVDFDAFSATSFQVDGAYYVSPNLAINALIATTEGDDAIDDDWTSYGVGGEYRFHGPISVALNWRTDEFDGYDADSWTIGLNFDLGTGSLQERQTQGPSLQGASNLHGALGGLLP